MENISGKTALPIPAKQGLHKHYWDSRRGDGTASQMHHIAAFLHTGWNYGAGNTVLEMALKRSGDLANGKVMNGGDYRLTVLMADLGSWLADNPGYHGKYVTMMVKTDFKTACKNNSRTSFPGDYSIDDDPELNE